jgi:hypothetical protein
MIEAIESLMSEHHLVGFTLNGYGSSKVIEDHGNYVITVDALPQLPFFIALAKLVDVPLETIKTEDEDHGSGCETCGYGGGTEYVITVPAKR